MCRDEFYMALDLVRGLSGESHVSKRLWRTVRTLKEVGPRLGLVSSEQLQNDEQSNAAVAMAGLAGHPVDEMALYGRGAGQSGQVRPLDTPHGMALDLTTLFEAAGGTFNLNGFEGMGGAMQNGDAYGGHPVPAYGTENDELARIMKDLF
jgi:hypothetical protein